MTSQEGNINDKLVSLPACQYSCFQQNCSFWIVAVATYYSYFETDYQSKEVKSKCTNLHFYQHPKRLDNALLYRFKLNIGLLFTPFS